jgi:mannitol-specific phosphotransferase system IIBC component
MKTKSVTSTKPGSAVVVVSAAVVVVVSAAVVVVVWAAVVVVVSAVVVVDDTELSASEFDEQPAATSPRATAKARSARRIDSPASSVAKLPLVASAVETLRSRPTFSGSEL